MKKIILNSILIVLFLLSLSSCDIFGGLSDTGETFIDITSPYNGASFLEGDNIIVNVTAEDPDGVMAVNLWVNDSLHSIDKIVPYSFSMENLNVGSHKFHITVKDSNDNLTISQKITIYVEEDPGGG